MKINFPAEPMPKINNLSRKKLTAPYPPLPSESNGRPLRSYRLVVNGAPMPPKYKSITDKLSVAHCALRVAPFTTSHILHANADGDANAGGIAIAFLH